MSQPFISDVRRAFFGGSTSEELEFYKAAADAGVTATDMLNLARGEPGETQLKWTTAEGDTVVGGTQGGFVDFYTGPASNEVYRGWIYVAGTNPALDSRVVIGPRIDIEGDNGNAVLRVDAGGAGGKHRLLVKFATGAEQVIALEP